MSIDVSQLVTEITSAASQVINQDVTQIQGFSDRQVAALAKQTQLIAAGIAAGEINEDLREFFLKSLEDMTMNFVKTLGGLLTVTIEKVWNAVVGVLWKTIETATGIQLTIPTTQLS